jgi:hypothetical protein
MLCAGGPGHGARPAAITQISQPSSKVPSITLSARSSIDCGIVKASALAVLAL